MRRFKTIFLEEAAEFLESLSEQVRDKIFYNIRIQYRLFAFWDSEKEATHGIVKKVWKVPTKEIAKAEEMRKQYFNSK